MATTRKTLRGALTIAGLAAVASLAACGEDSIDIVRPNLESDMFRSYVALGNSITAGYQSGGIVDSTQLESYAYYLFRAMGYDSAQYNVALLRRPGCPPPLTNIVTGVLLDNAPKTNPPFCALRANTEATLNNVAVPGATVLDPTATSTTVGSSALTTFILGGRSQVSRALEANPTFVTAWIGNNDVLAAGVTGLINPTAQSASDPVASPGITPTATFTAAYGRMVDSLKLAPRLQGGVLIGVVNVSNAPVLFPGMALNNPQFKGAIDQAVGRTVTVINCTATTSLISLRIIDLLKAIPTLPLSCERIPTQNVAGQVFVLDATEQTAINTAVAAYNAYIAQKAEEAGFAYYDPNPDLAALRAGPTPLVPSVPNFLDPANPFGLYISLDGVHPRRRAHKLVTNRLIEIINAEYGTSLDPIEVN